MVAHSPIKLLQFNFQPVRRRYLDSCCCFVLKTVEMAWSFRSCDGSILLLQRKITVRKEHVLRLVGQENIVLCTKAPSTRIRIFWKTRLFYPFWVRVHTETAFSVTENEAFRKRSPEWIFLKTPFSCCRVDG